MSSIDLENIDLAEVSAHLRAACGPVVEGAVVGRTVLRDAVVAHLGCSELEGEEMVDTMIGRGFLVWREEPGGPAAWDIHAR
jgi:myo-inositol catabolism protein IolC